MLQPSIHFSIFQKIMSAPQLRECLVPLDRIFIISYTFNSYITCRGFIANADAVSMGV